MIDNSSKVKKNKKPFFILGAIAIMLVIAVVIFLLASASKLNRTDNIAVNMSAEKRFNQFATYLLFKKESDNLEGEYERGRAYELDLQLAADRIDADYWTRGKDLLKEAIGFYLTDELRDENLVIFLEEYEKSFNFVNDYHQLKVISKEYLLSLFRSSGLDSTIEYINDYYSTLSNYDIEQFQTIIESTKQEYTTFVEILSIYATNNCISGSSIDDTCASNVAAQDERFNALLTSMQEASYSATHGFRLVVQKLESDCWQISQRLNETAKNEEVQHHENTAQN